MIFTTYDKIDKTIGDIVYQMDAKDVKVLHCRVEEIIGNNIKATIVNNTPGSPNIVFTAPGQSFHSNPKQLVHEWITTNLKRYEVDMPQFLYRLMTLYMELGGSVHPQLLDRFRPVHKEEAI